MKPVIMLLMAALMATAIAAVVGLSSGNRETPQVNVPVALRQHNWGSTKGGSCVHASLVTAFRWQGQPRMAEWWKDNHKGGEHHDSLLPQLDKAGVRYVATVDENDVAFLEWSVATRRGCMIAVNNHSHAVFLAHLDSEKAGIIGTNFPGEVIWVDRDEFLEDWRDSRSWAVAIVYTPAPPLAPQE
jgi:hypothetical protein